MILPGGSTPASLALPPGGLSGDRPPCPRCGGVRLIARTVVLADSHRRAGLPLLLALRYRLACRRGPCVLLRHRYHCELCGTQWTVDEFRFSQ